MDARMQQLSDRSPRRTEVCMSLSRRTVALLGLGALLLVATGTAGPAAAHSRAGQSRTITYTIPGDAVFPEGIAVDHRTGFFYVGSTTDGTIFRGHLRRPAMEVFLAGGGDGRTTAIGMKVDKRGRLFVAGGGTGQVWVYDTRTKALVRHFDTGRRTGATFLNDVALARNGDAFVTDSLFPELLRIRASEVRPGAPTGTPEAFVNFTGTPAEYVAGFNLNGIALSADGKHVVVIASNTGRVFRVSLRDRSVAEIPITGGPLPMGDGILIKGNLLLVSRNAAELTVSVALNGRLTSGRVFAAYTDPLYMFPTTIALARGRVLSVNAQFDRRNAGQPPVLPFTVASVPLARVLAGNV
jgi:DNA-binding beta-propeller fold protein YncE